MSHRPIRIAAIAMTALIAAAAPGLAQEPANLGEALTKGKISLNLRYRYEDVDQSGLHDRGRASTLRTTLAYRTGWWKRLAGFVEFEDVHDLGLSNDHNNLGSGSLWNGVSDRPVIVDPPLTEINQAYFDWKPSESFKIRGGRQEIVVDNARFIGNVGWRQNHQSFDGGRVDFSGVKNLALGFTYITRQRAINGSSRPMATTHLDGALDFPDIGTLRAYLLSIDYDQEAFWQSSTRTFGASFAGSAKLSDTLDLTYRLELASQNDAGNNPLTVDASYLRGDLGFLFGTFNVGAGYEVLGGGTEGSFGTPLATLHKFNGWADKFLNTPGDGLRDAFLSIGARFGAWNLVGTFHDFSADSGGASWGNEFDAQVLYTTPWQQKIALKFALYDADQWATDTDKIWLWTQWGF